MKQKWIKKIKDQETQTIKAMHLTILSKIFKNQPDFPRELLFQISRYLFNNPLTFSTPIYLLLSDQLFLTPSTPIHLIIQTPSFQHLTIDFFWLPPHPLSSKNKSDPSVTCFLKFFQPDPPCYFSLSKEIEKKQMDPFMTDLCSEGDRLHLQNIGIYVTKRIMNKVISTSIKYLMSKKIIFFHLQGVKCIWVVEDEREISVQELVERLMKQRRERAQKQREEKGRRIYLLEKKVKKWGKQIILMGEKEVLLEDCYIEQD